LQRESLGESKLGGIDVQGTRETKNYATLSDKSPGYVVVSDFWYSPKLQMTLGVYGKDSRRGDRTAQITELRLAEPDPARFMSPVGYAIVDERNSEKAGIKHPEITHWVNPKFPSDYRIQGSFDGVSIVGIVVDIDGYPENPAVVKSLTPVFDQRAIEAVMQYRFRPAMKNDEPIPVQIDVEVHFRVMGRP
jgi:TonB family protein